MASFSSYITFVLVLPFLLFSNVSMSQSIIKTLPGFSGDLPFKLETGYIGVGESERVQLFYYFIESERNPKDDPLVLWLTGGPGCSALSGLIYEIGPFTFNYANSSGYKPTLMLNPYSWTKVASFIFLDQPVGTGFSYSTTSDGYYIGDISSAAQTSEFIRKWLMNHPEFLTNPLYIAGDSYSGMTVPVILQDLSNGTEIGQQPPPPNIQGYILGNPFTDVKYDLNSRIIFAHRKALLSNSLYQSTKRNCNGEYMRPDPTNAACLSDLQAVTTCLNKINNPQVLEPKCNTLSPKPKRSMWDHSSLAESSLDAVLSTPKAADGPWCRNYNYLLSYTWANDKTVQRALHVRKGTIKEWERCNTSLCYGHDLISSIDYERNLTKKNYRALIYSGDHDMVIPYVGTQEWIESLGLPVSNDWKPWYVDGQVAGYTVTYAEKKYTLTYVTVKGAGHTAPEYKPKECLAMIDRWFAHFPL
ncbi:hypothetical protein SLEP1_g30010 [Rubroshorea leprosula]|uniref:Uncharacterized protein n=1 Tax=Rubroshorea leprosula TaxID=152421 RepID=A0AAV5K4J5_9ROSI|nr:hypothetical protein SLEP1_g30010 [Rubroshorea leprosula]